MNIFCEPFRKEIRVGGKLLPIRTDFRAVLKMMDEIESAGDASGKLMAILGLYKEIPVDVESAVRAVTDFISEVPESGKRGSGRTGRKNFSYRKDAPYIVSDFLRFYGIDLTSCRYLHWHKFQVLLEGLSGDSETKQRIAYRSVNAAKIKDRHERERIQRIQRAISLEDIEADEGRIGELFGNLM